MMLGKLLGKKGDAQEKSNPIREKVSKMDLTQMRTFINNKDEINEEGIVEVLKKLVTRNDITKKRYIENDDMDVKIKKSFDLILSITEHKKITVEAVALIQEFLVLYSDLIVKFDTEHKQIYGSKLNASLEKTVNGMIEVAKIKRKMNILNQ